MSISILYSSTVTLFSFTLHLTKLIWITVSSIHTTWRSTIHVLSTWWCAIHVLSTWWCAKHVLSTRWCSILICRRATILLLLRCGINTLIRLAVHGLLRCGKNRLIRLTVHGLLRCCKNRLIRWPIHLLLRCNIHRIIDIYNDMYWLAVLVILLWLVVWVRCVRIYMMMFMDNCGSLAETYSNNAAANTTKYNSSDYCSNSASTTWNNVLPLHRLQLLVDILS